MGGLDGLLGSGLEGLLKWRAGWTAEVEGWMDC